jgi:dTDP-4-amino-4,6-dideoxygalactose transaminase
VIEDAAEALGATWTEGAMSGSHAGTVGDVGTYSFNGNKIITTSGGGMLVADDADLVARARKLATQAREPAPHYEHVEVGFNYRMSNVLAGIGRGQLRVLDQRVASRRAVFETYREALADLGEIQWMPEPAGMHSTRWLTCFELAPRLRGGGPGSRADAAARRDRVLRNLERHSIEARPVWKPMHLQPLFHGAPYFPHADGDDVAARLFAAGICLPSGSNMTAAQQERVIDQLRRALARAEAPGAVV